MTYVGVDGCQAGWVAVIYDEDDYRTAKRYENITELWADYHGATEILIDIPIGLREASSDPRPCDAAARDCLRPKQYRSVFATPIREVARKAYLEGIGYEEAKKIQENNTDGSLSPFSWGIIPKIGEVDHFLLEEGPNVQGKIFESHPEVCFWAFNGGGENDAMDYAKTGQPAAAFWERLDVLREIDPDIINHIKDAGTDLDYKIANHDLLDAFALALTAHPKTGDTDRLPDPWPDDEGDPENLPMMISYAVPGE